MVKKPQVVLANSWRKMPQQNLQDKEVEDLIAFFKWVSEIDTHDWPPQDSNKLPSSSIRRMVAGAVASPGGALFKEKGCFACHKIGGTGGNVGPAMEGVGNRYDELKLSQYIQDPASVNPKSRMPKLPDLTPDQAKQIAQFLMGLK
ncbi:MAG TPA: c-type cytochrome, partial [Thermodesulfobacteriota bacterium]|nr:c-type cytochrome [Thermodesulfobacteriota bacterium]